MAGYLAEFVGIIILSFILIAVKYIVASSGSKKGIKTVIKSQKDGIFQIGPHVKIPGHGYTAKHRRDFLIKNSSIPEVKFDKSHSLVDISWGSGEKKTLDFKEIKDISIKEEIAEAALDDPVIPYAMKKIGLEAGNPLKANTLAPEVAPGYKVYKIYMETINDEIILIGKERRQRKAKSLVDKIVEFSDIKLIS